MYTEYIKSLQLKNKLPIEMSKILNVHLAKEDTQMATKHTKDAQHLVIREVQIITIKRYNYTSPRMSQIQRPNNTKDWQ